MLCVLGGVDMSIWNWICLFLAPNLKILSLQAGHDELGGTSSKQATLHIKLLKCTNKALLEEF